MLATLARLGLLSALRVTVPTKESPMLKPLAPALLLAVTLAGCVGPLRVVPISSGGDLSQLRADLGACEMETLAFGLIPDLGFTVEFKKEKCMKARGWVMSASNAYAWIGPGSAKQLARYPSGDVLISPICPRNTACVTVVPTSEPAEWTAWASEFWGDSQRRREDAVVVGDAAQCDVIRQRVAAKGIPAAPCRGPLYYKRAGG